MILRSLSIVIEVVFRSPSINLIHYILNPLILMIINPVINLLAYMFNPGNQLIIDMETCLIENYTNLLFFHIIQIQFDRFINQRREVFEFFLIIFHFLKKQRLLNFNTILHSNSKKQLITLMFSFDSYFHGIPPFPQKYNKSFLVNQRKNIFKYFVYMLKKNSMQMELLKDTLGNRDWRLRNLYKIKNKDGQVVNFEPNWAQQTLYKPHHLNIILKARQLGITTYHALMFLDTCLFNHNINCAIVADSKSVAQEIFIDKVKFAYDNLPQFVRDLSPAYRDNINQMRFSNGSVFRVSTSLRGGTLQLLHITEFAKICQENPKKANEIISGALNAVQAGQFICIESTARGREGHFYNICKEAQALQDARTPLGKLDWKLWFFPWHQHPDYVIDSKNVLISKDMEQYFLELESKDIILTPEQKAWYVKKMQTQGEYMKREYPSTPEESFESANEGFYFAKQISQARHEKRICHLPYDDNAKTYTSWDIGIGDSCAIWIWQLVGKEIHCIEYYENSDEPLAHYVKWLKTKPYLYEKHYLPHDAAAREKGTGKSFADLARDAGLKVDVLPRQSNEMFGIECLRNMLPRFFFDYAKCDKGIKAIENFRKEWNEKLGCYRERSYHDWASHGSKALIYGAEAIQRISGGSGMSAEEWNRMRKQWI